MRLCYLAPILHAAHAQINSNNIGFLRCEYYGRPSDDSVRHIVDLQLGAAESSMACVEIVVFVRIDFRGISRHFRFWSLGDG